MISSADWALLAVSFIWGATFVVVKDALSGVSTFLFLALRFSLAAAALALILRKRLGGQGRGFRDEWRGALVCGFFLFTGLRAADRRLAADDGVTVRLPDRHLHRSGTFAEFVRPSG